MKKVLSLIILGLIVSIVPVNASNHIDYKLEISKSYKFKETISYVIEDYKQVKNGENDFADIINQDVTVDILGKEKYNKTKVFKNKKYYVTLKHTYSEYSLSNSAFLRNCFEKSEYKYDTDKISFSGSGGFNCFLAKNFTITVITNFPVSDTNAIKSGNKYIWYPQNYNFNMNLTLTKQYEKKEIENTTWDNITPSNDEQTENNTNTNTDNNNQTETESNEIGNYLAIGIGVIILISLPIIAIILKKKKDALDEI